MAHATTLAMARSQPSTAWLSNSSRPTRPSSSSDGGLSRASFTSTTSAAVIGLRQTAEINYLACQHRDRGFDSAIASWWEAEPAGDLQLFRRKTI
jgi:hypothetical protein